MKRSLFLAVTMYISTIVMTAALAETEIPLWYGYKDFFGPVFEKTLGKFNASQSDYKVTWQGYDNYPTTLQALVAAYRANNHPALVMIYDIGTATMTSSGAIRPMHEIMAKEGYKIATSDFVNGAINYYADSKGKLNALPFFASTLLLFVNDDKLKAAGIDRKLETWEQVEAAMRALKANGESCPFAHKVNAWRDIEQFAAIHNEPIATKQNGYDGADAKLTLASDLHVGHASDLINWTNEGLMVLQGDLGGLNTTNAFKGGICAMYLGSSSDYARLLKAADFNWSVRQIPIYEGYKRHNTFIGGNALWIMNGHDEEVYKGIAVLFDFIQKNAIQEQYVRDTGYLPITLSSIEALTKKGFFKAKDYSGLNVALQSLNQPSGDYSLGIRLGFYPQIRKAWKEQIERAYAGEISAKEALENASAEGNKLLSRFARTMK